MADRDLLPHGCGIMMIIATTFLLLAWMVGFLADVTLNGLLHGLLPIAAVLVVVGVLQSSAKRH
jgi:hypothetical protein